MSTRRRSKPPPTGSSSPSPLAFRKAHNRFLAHKDRRNRSIALSAAPLKIELEITNRCPLSCRTCARSYWDRDLNPEGDLDLALLARLAPFLERASVVWLSGYGESLAAPVFFDALSHINRFECRTGVTSNGTLLKPATVDRLLEHRLGGLAVSLDGASEQMIRATRSGISLQEVLRKIAYLNEKKAALGVSFPQLIFRLTASLKNIDQVPDLVRMAAQHRAERVDVTVARIFHPSQVEESLLHDLPRARAVLREAQMVAEEHRIAVCFPDFNHQGCDQPFTTLLVKWNGEVAACCASAFHSDPPLQIRLGNLQDASPQELWNSARACSVRAGLLGQGVLDPVCAGCAFYSLSLETLTKIVT